MKNYCLRAHGTYMNFIKYDAYVAVVINYIIKMDVTIIYNAYLQEIK